MVPAIPDRWIDYKPIGERIEGTRFIAFKVPLREHITKSVDQKIRLDGQMLMEMVPNLGMIIDLTNTWRYYDPNIFQRKGVQHKKLMIPGHITPPKHLVNKFKNFVKKFIESNLDNDKLIGVHCTHGVNRTGYLICNYMISEMTIEPNDAITRFASARGHKIERNNYVDALKKCLVNNIVSKSNNDETNNERTCEPRTKYKNRNYHRIENWRVREENNSYRSRTENWRIRDGNNSETSRVRTNYYDRRSVSPCYQRGQSNHRSNSPAQECVKRSSNSDHSENHSVQNNERCNIFENSQAQECVEPSSNSDHSENHSVQNNERCNIFENSQAQECVEPSSNSDHRENHSVQNNERCNIFENSQAQECVEPSSNSDHRENHSVQNNERCNIFENSQAQECVEPSSNSDHRENHSVQNNERCNIFESNRFQPRLRTDYYNTRIISRKSTPRTDHLMRRLPYCPENHYPQLRNICTPNRK